MGKGKESSLEMWRLIISAPDGWDSGPGFESKLCCTVTVFVLFCCRESVLRALLNRGAKPDCLSLPARQGTFSELGIPQHCRDNVTMFSDNTVVGYSNITLFVVAILHLDTETLKYLEFSLVPEALQYYVVALPLSRS